MKLAFTSSLRRPVINILMALRRLRVGWYRHRFRGRCRGRCHCQHPIPAPAHLPWYHLGTTGASTSTDVDKNTTLGVTIMCEKHFALSAKYIEVIFFTIPIGFCPIFPWYWLSKDKIDSLNQLMVPVPKLVPAPWHHWHRHWHFSSVSKLGTGTNKNWYQPTLSPKPSGADTLLKRDDSDWCMKKVTVFFAHLFFLVDFLDKIFLWQLRTYEISHLGWIVNCM